MDISSLIGEKMPKKEQAAAMEYTAQAASPIVNGEVKLTIAENSFIAAALFDTAEVPFAEINALIFADYTVTVKADSGDYAFLRMGEWAERFYDALCAAYNNAVLRSLFIKGNPLLTAKGAYRFIEKGAVGDGSAFIHVYENSVAALPPNLSARRVPLCFVCSMENSGYMLTLKLNTGECYTYAKLGYDTAPFAEAVEKQIRALREKSLAAIKELDPSLDAAKATQLAKNMPLGAAASLAEVAKIAPSFVAALEEKIANTRAAAYYTALKEVCDPAKMYIGFRKNEAGASSVGNLSGLMDGGMAGMLGGLTGGSPLEALGSLAGGNTAGETAETPPPDPYLIWLIAPSPDGRYAAVEFAEADAATFIYRTGGDFAGFARQLNRALEAIGFKREVIRMTDEELRKPENADYLMAAKRTASLQFIRSNCAGRIIHASPESWKRKLMEQWSGAQDVREHDAPKAASSEADKKKFCAQCGAALAPGVKFCGGCGMKV